MLRFVTGISAMAVSAFWAATSLDGVEGVITAILVGGAGVVVAITGLIKVLHEVRTTETVKAAALLAADERRAAALLDAEERKAAARRSSDEAPAERKE